MFLFKLETQYGAAAEPPTVSVSVPNWRVGDEIHVGAQKLRVVGVRDDEADEPPVLIVEDELKMSQPPGCRDPGGDQCH
jgi:hypothetical protein